MPQIVSRTFANQNVNVTATSLAYYYTSADMNRGLYDLLLAYYLNNGLYDELRAGLGNVDLDEEALKPIRNPAYRCVEFYASKLWPGALPGALPIRTEFPQIVQHIERIWAWSNWSSQKQVMARWQAIFGDVFLRVTTRTGASESVKQVAYQLIDPRYVPDFDVDERGFVSWFRSDVPIEIRVDGDVEDATYTEVWDKENGTFTLWSAHDKGFGADLETLPEPDEVREIAEFGVDFIPVVHCKGQDIGEKRGVGAYQLSVDKIDEANRMATRLHMLLFKNNRNVWVAAANAMSEDGRPIPAPLINTDGTNELEIGDESVIRMPGMSSLTSLIPDIKYDAALSILNAHMAELEQDLPELKYHRLKDAGANISGKALRLMLADAIDKLLEARGNAEAALIRANQMAMTLAQVHKIEGFAPAQIGTFEAGAFEHAFKERPVLPLTEDEKATVYKTYIDAALPRVTAMRRAGFTDMEIEQTEQDARDEKLRDADLASAFLDQARREFDQETRAQEIQEAL